MELLNPIFAFAALSILFPIILHYWNRNAGKTIDFGSLELLRNIPTSRASSLKITHPFLLLLRILGLTVLVLFLMNLVNQEAVPSIEKMRNIYILEEGAKTGALLMNFDSLQDRIIRTSSRELEGTIQKYQFETPLPDSIIILGNRFFSSPYFPLKNHPVPTRWIHPFPQKKQVIIQAIQREKTLQYWVGDFNPSGLNTKTFKWPNNEESIQLNDSTLVQKTKEHLNVKSPNSAYQIDIITVDSLIFHYQFDSQFKEEQKVFIASLEAIAAFLDRPLQLIKWNKNIASAKYLSWWSKEEIPEFQGCLIGPPFLGESPRANKNILLNPTGNSLNPNPAFTAELLQIITEEERTKIWEADQRNWNEIKQPHTNHSISQSIDSRLKMRYSRWDGWILAAFLLFFFLERRLARKRLNE